VIELGKYKNNAERRKAGRDRRERRERRRENEQIGPILQGEHINSNPQHGIIMNDIQKKYLKLLGMTAKEYKEQKGGENNKTT